VLDGYRDAAECFKMRQIILPSTVINLYVLWNSIPVYKHSKICITFVQLHAKVALLTHHALMTTFKL